MTSSGIEKKMDYSNKFYETLKDFEGLVELISVKKYKYVLSKELPLQFKMRVNNIDLVAFFFEENWELCLKEYIERYINRVDLDYKKGNSETEFSEICNSLCNMIEEKDKRYGNSALKPLDIFAKHHNYGSRLDEKLARVKNSDELRKNDVADIIGGLILICKDKGWNNFEDQLD